MKEGNIRRIINAITIFVLVMTLLMNTALCDQNVWDCPECGRTGNMGEYCGSCAHPAPWLATGDTENAESAASVSVGDIIRIGHYEQDNNMENGPEEIEWIILDYDEKEQKALVLSRYGLDAQPYNTKYGNIVWERCTLRKWLNKEFLSQAFSEEERAAILITETDNSASQRYGKWNTDGGKDTQDQIFLLSCAEANRYLGVKYMNNNTASRAAPTAYAVARGAWKSDGNQTDAGEAAGWWWLRSPGRNQAHAAYVPYDGSLYFNFVNNVFGIVRPALWLNLEADIQKGMEGTDDKTALSNKSESDAFVSVGDTVCFGHYEQDNDLNNGPEEIEWVVLDCDEEEHKVLLLSEYGLDAKLYNEKDAKTNWEKCSLRKWLNYDFLQQAFSEEEQTAILTTAVDNSTNQGYSGWNTKGGNNTKDKIFLLSYAEANRYLDVTFENNSNIKSRITPTAYAVAQGAWKTERYRTADGEAAAWWWLRTSGNVQECAAYVFYGGSLWQRAAFYDYGTVRPTIWVDLDTDIRIVEKKATSPKTTDDKTALSASVSVGDIVCFGRYEQDDDHDNGQEEIEWIVLDHDEKEHKALLLSRYCLGVEMKPFDDQFREDNNITWEGCTLRAWLNDEFRNYAFSAAEQSAILVTSVYNSEQSEPYTVGENNTQDQIFLLSCEEARRYLGISDAYSNNIKSRAAGTPLLYLWWKISDEPDRTAEGMATIGWWLRSGCDDTRYYVCSDGSMESETYFSYNAIRPALWLNLQSDIF